ncbi:unnamed protein product [Dibothriocephalus latus]|uniref:Uncharacterized protein n=1 Tax=Dibothriocephalus latus TaxID=60516 RepID=A0A3P6UUM9_DIBLA|nr:unnamed protein product [Dibothriocephalus latus]
MEEEFVFHKTYMIALLTFANVLSGSIPRFEEEIEEWKDLQFSVDFNRSILDISRSPNISVEYAEEQVGLRKRQTVLRAVIEACMPREFEVPLKNTFLTEIPIVELAMMLV